MIIIGSVFLSGKRIATKRPQAPWACSHTDGMRLAVAAVVYFEVQFLVLFPKIICGLRLIHEEAGFILLNQDSANSFIKSQIINIQSLQTSWSLFQLVCSAL